MQKPDIPGNEAQRIAVLKGLNILDTAPEERFDRITRIAKRIFNVPIALVSLVDVDRQWFKSHEGLDATETPRDISFCGHAILGDEIFTIEDASTDDRFADNPLVTEHPDIRFYAGCPLRMADNSKLGTLCLIDTQPRTLSREEEDILADLASMVENELAALQLATMDELTTTTNRRGFLQLGQHSLDSSARQNTATSLAYIDLNKFKQINDRFGHGEGDHALVMFAECMRQSFRGSDLIARMGGDEFVVLISQADKDLAREIMQRFEQRLNKYNQFAGRGYNIEFTHGIVEYNRQQHGGIAALLEAADEIMYQARSLKRGETHRWGEIPTSATFPQ